MSINGSISIPPISSSCDRYSGLTTAIGPGFYLTIFTVRNPCFLPNGVFTTFPEIGSCSWEPFFLPPNRSHGIFPHYNFRPISPGPFPPFRNTAQAYSLPPELHPLLVPLFPLLMGSARHVPSLSSATASTGLSLSRNSFLSHEPSSRHSYIHYFLRFLTLP